MHLVGFIIRIYHDARSPERQLPEKYSLANAVMNLRVPCGELLD